MLSRKELQNADDAMMIVRTIKAGYSDKIIGSIVGFKITKDVVIFDVQILGEVGTSVEYIEPTATKLPGEGSLLPQIYGAARKIGYDLRWDGDWRILFWSQEKLNRLKLK